VLCFRGLQRLRLADSRTGTTRRVATELAALGGWDVEPLIDMKVREGLIGYGRSLLDAIFGRTTRLAAPRHDPADYHIVVIGTPVWSNSVSAPVRTWLEEHARELPPLAFFATENGRGAARAFRQMASIAGTIPVVTLELTAKDLRRGPLAPRLTPLIATIRGAVGTPRPAAPPAEPPQPTMH
jgi:hypothetical protein